jgi:hypothetical protein
MLEVAWNIVGITSGVVLAAYVAAVILLVTFEDRL